MYEILRVKDLVKSLGGREVLSRVSFSVEKGEIVVISGPSGAGKSTLLRCLNRLIEPDGGEIIFDGVSVFDMDVLELRRLMGFVSQVPVIFDGTVRDNLLFAPRLHGISVGDEEMVRILESVGLPSSYLNKLANELSVGEQQRVAIARALILKPKLLLMDEPTSHLDPENTKLVEGLIRRFNSKFGITFIIVSHDAEQARRLGNKILYLENGSIRLLR